MLHNLDFCFLMTQIKQSEQEHGLDDVPSPVLCSIREAFVISGKGRQQLPREAGGESSVSAFPKHNP